MQRPKSKVSRSVIMIVVDDQIQYAAFVASAKRAAAPLVSEQSDSAGTGIGTIPPFLERRLGYCSL